MRLLSQILGSILPDRNFFQEKSPNAPELQDVPRGKTLLENYDCVLIGDVSPEDLGEKLIEDLVKFAEQKGGGVIFSFWASI